MQQQDDFDARDIVPVPDPTRLTTQHLLREIARSEKITEAKLEGQRSTTRAEVKNLDERLIEVKVRLELIERRTAGQTLVIALSFGVIFIVMTITGVLAALAR